ncbi:MAG: Ldh family oxidoreductase [Ectobacillus sp.]
MHVFEAGKLREFCKDVLTRLDVPEEDAAVVAEALVKADLEGVASHGISRLGIYSQRLMDGRINRRPNITIEQRGHSVLVADGDNGLGQVVSYHAVVRGIELAKQAGVAAIAVKNSNHFGTAAYFCQMICERNMASIGFTNSPPGIAPWGGRAAFFGTNPIAFGFPTENGVPVIIDLSTSVVARGKIILANKQGLPIPDHWALDQDGNMTNDAGEALKGSVLPLGGAKGSALALAVEILTGVLSGAAFGPHVNNIYSDESSKPANVGHFFILFDIEKFMPIAAFKEYLAQLLQEMKEVPKVPGTTEIRYPGERRHNESRKRASKGVALSDSVQQELKQIGAKVKAVFPEPLCVKEGTL